MPSYRHYDPAPPSQRRALLASLVGQRLARVVRYLDWPADEAMRLFELTPATLFRFTIGPVELTFENGLVVGIDSDPGSASLVVWRAAWPGGREAGMLVEDPTVRVEPRILLDASDARYGDPTIQALVGSSIQRLTMLARSFPRARAARGEVALEATFNGGEPLLFAHGLHDDSDDFALLRPSEVGPFPLSRHPLA